MIVTIVLTSASVSPNKDTPVANTALADVSFKTHAPAAAQCRAARG